MKPAKQAHDRLREMETSPEFQAVLAREFPYRAASLAIVGVRGRRALTQQALADLVGTTQSVIARAESGKHPIEITLLKRIADATGEALHVAFGDPGALGQQDVLAEALPAEPAADPASTGDELLDEFNRANTARDLVAARQAARRIESEPTTPRRQLALALNEYNARRHEGAVEWAERALRGNLPPVSQDTALLVLGLSLVQLRKARKALAILRQVRADSPHAWLVSAARADAYVELHQDKNAMREAAAILEMAPDIPEARYQVARTAWHADHIWEALDHISVFRADSPNNLDGLLLHGGILGYLGSKYADQGAFASALGLFRQVLATGDCEVLRLYAITAARMGRWQDAFKVARRLQRHRGDRGRDACEHAANGRDHQHVVADHILPDAFAALADHDPAELEQATNRAETLFGSSRLIRSQRALARALRGDLSGTLSALGITEPEVSRQSADDQIAVAAAYYVRRDYAAAYKTLRGVEGELSRPIGLLRLAECAVAASEYAEARRILSSIGTGDDVAADVARLASALLRAEASSARAAAPTVDLSWYPLTEEAPELIPRASPWEGRHHRTTPMLGVLPGRHFIH